jgi:hypothetical protein
MKTIVCASAFLMAAGMGMTPAPTVGVAAPTTTAVVSVAKPVVGGPVGLSVLPARPWICGMFPWINVCKK